MKTPKYGVKFYRDAKGEYRFVLDRPGLVHEVCPYCRGDGRRDAPAAPAGRYRDQPCFACAGRGYVVTESEREAA